VTALWFVLPLLAADDRSEEIVHQQDVVEAAALAVAKARQSGARKRDVAALMATYREEAEQLAAMEPPPSDPTDEGAQSAAVAALTKATAEGRSDPAARAVVELWLGPLDPRLDVLAAALASAGSVRAPELARTMVLDVRTQCVAVMAASAHDATEAEAAARSARVRAATLSAPNAPGAGGGMENKVDERTLLAAADEAAARAKTDWAVHARAAALCAESAAPIPPG
jgi:hypothetical protein